MTTETNTVWVVAGADTSVRWSQALAAAGYAPEEHPWSAVRAPEDAAAPARALNDDEYDLVLFTSPHAAAALPAGSGKGRRCACVGHRTADAARRSGFEVALLGSAGAEALSEQILSELPGVKRVLFLRGLEARAVGPDRLAQAGVLVQEVVAYEMMPHPDFERSLSRAGQASVIVLGSPRAVEALAQHADALAADVRFVAPGETTGTAARRHWPDHVHIAERPDPEMIVQAVQAASQERRRTAS